MASLKKLINDDFSVRNQTSYKFYTYRNVFNTEIAPSLFKGGKMAVVFSIWRHSIKWLPDNTFFFF